MRRTDGMDRGFDRPKRRVSLSTPKAIPSETESKVSSPLPLQRTERTSKYCPSQSLSSKQEIKRSTKQPTRGGSSPTRLIVNGSRKRALDSVPPLFLLFFRSENGVAFHFFLDGRSTSHLSFQPIKLTRRIPACWYRSGTDIANIGWSNLDRRSSVGGQ